MSDTNDVANCRLSAYWQFTPRPDLGDMTKILIFAVQTSYAKMNKLPDYMFTRRFLFMTVLFIVVFSILFLQL